jgi:hypothetical protein
LQRFGCAVSLDGLPLWESFGNGWSATVLLDCRPDQTIDATVDRPIVKVEMPTGYHTQPQVNSPTEDVGFRVLHGSEKITTCYDTPV